jgi:uncharacterized protein
MSALTPVPLAVRPLIEFPRFLRPFGFALVPEQTIAFLAAVTLLGPKAFADVRRAAHATLAPPPERRVEFDALFTAFFAGGVEVSRVAGASEGQTVVKDDRGHSLEPEPAIRTGDGGRTATRVEQLAGRVFSPSGPDAQLKLMVRRAPNLLPRRHAFRRAVAKSGDAIDLRRTMRRVVTSDGEVARLIMARRRTRQRRILLLIDISGSMKDYTQNYLRFAHALSAAADQVETFTFGTRLTRISRAMALRDRARALAAAQQSVDDWDGGTRIGEALGAFMAVPRFAAYARGALCLVLSDGLERGDPTAMVNAVRHLARRVWRLTWLTPLAADDRFRPQTAALQAILPFLDSFGEGGSIASLCAYVLSASGGDHRWDVRRWRQLLVDDAADH